MLHEASSVSKAIEKAWTDSGKPREFSIKVHELGEKNFFGFTKRPAIVSITYEPRKQVSKPFDRKGQTSTPQGSKGPRPLPSASRLDGKADLKERRETFRVEKQPAPQQSPQPKPVQLEQQEPDIFWTPELIDDIGGWFKDVVALFDNAITFELQADKRMLRLILDKNLLPSQEDERQLYMSLSYLAIQFLKKKHKKKLRGYHLVINSKNYATPNQSSNTSSF